MMSYNEDWFGQGNGTAFQTLESSRLKGAPPRILCLLVDLAAPEISILVHTFSATTHAAQNQAVAAEYYGTLEETGRLAVAYVGVVRRQKSAKRVDGDRELPDQGLTDEIIAESHEAMGPLLFMQ